MDLLTTRCSEKLAGVLSCYDRIVIIGTLPGACFADGLTSFLYSRGVRVFDCARFGSIRRDAGSRSPAKSRESPCHEGSQTGSSKSREPIGSL